MTLLETIRLIERVAKGQPSVNSIVENDVFRINEAAAVQYGVFAFTQGMHRGDTGSDFITYSFTFFYVDRLTESGTNVLEVQSVGVETLDNILKVLADKGVGVEQYSFQPFTQRFVDECAGVYTSVSLTVLRNSVCAFRDPSDFNDDFNEDYG